MSKQQQEPGKMINGKIDTSEKRLNRMEKGGCPSLVGSQGVLCRTGNLNEGRQNMNALLMAMLAYVGIIVAACGQGAPGALWGITNGPSITYKPGNLEFSPDGQKNFKW